MTRMRTDIPEIFRTIDSIEKSWGKEQNRSLRNCFFSLFLLGFDDSLKEIAIIPDQVLFKMVWRRRNLHFVTFTDRQNNSYTHYKTKFS